MEQLTLDDVARTTDQQAVRARFDARNLGWLRLLAWTAMIVAAPGLIAALVRGSWLKATVVAISLVTTFVALRVVRPRSTGKLAQRVRSNASGFVIGWCALQTLICVFISGHSEGLIACATILPFTMIGLRMLSSELLSLHLLIGAIVIGGVSVAPPPSKKEPEVAPLIVSTAVINGIMLSVEVLLSRRWKREILSDWSERRRNAQEQVRMRDELHYARDVQLSMLPDAPPRLDWLDLAGLSLPATEVGGDYYDYLAVDGSLAIVTGDVAGHGLASGIVLAALRGGFTLLRESLTRPAEVLQRLHELVAQTSRRRMLVTCAVLLLDPARRRATIASAGHPPLLLRRAQDGSVQRIELFAPPLGVRLPLQVESAEIAFASGDVFVVHSDGVYETLNPAGDTYGFDRLESLVQSCGGAAANEICDAIARDLVQFRAGGVQDDDVTLVVARIV